MTKDAYGLGSCMAVGPPHQASHDPVEYRLEWEPYIRPETRPRPPDRSRMTVDMNRALDMSHNPLLVLLCDRHREELEAMTRGRQPL